MTEFTQIKKINVENRLEEIKRFDEIVNYSPFKGSILDLVKAKGFSVKTANKLINLEDKVLSRTSSLYRRAKKEKEEQYRKNIELEELNTTDSLTGLKNRRFFFGDEQDKKSHGEMRRLFLEAQRSENVLSVIILDGDHFKRVNDTFGHQIGDERLKEIANIIKSTARESDIVGKYGGEEFIVVLQNTNIEQAKILAERINKNVEDAKLPNNKQTTQTISAGVAFFDPKVSSDITDEKVLIGQADEALYAAKKSGRNRVITFGSEEYFNYKESLEKQP